MYTASSIINAFTDIDDMMKTGNGPIMLLTPMQMFEMGQFHQWAKQHVDNDNLNMDAIIPVPDDFDWVIGETQGW